MNKTQENLGVAEVGNQEDGGGDDAKSTAGDEANVANQHVLLEGFTQLSKDLRAFKQDVKRDLREFRRDVKKTTKEDFAEFKVKVIRELQSQHASIAEAQTHIADLESACLEMKDMLLTVVK